MKVRLVAFLLACGGVAAAAALLTGCVSPPTPADAVAPWRPPAKARMADSVWPAVRARQAKLAQPVALADLADLALANSPATRQVWSEALAASEQVRQAEGYFMPALVATAGASRQRTLAEPNGFDLDAVKYGPALQLNYLVLNFGGGRRAAVEQALQTVYATDYTFNRTVQGVLLAVETAYYDLVSATSAVAVADANVKDAKTALEAAEVRKNAGTATALDVLQAQALYDQSLYGLANAQGLVSIAQGGLSQAVGLPADAALNIVTPTNDLPPALKVDNLRPWIDAALARRPDIAALRATLAASEAAVRVAGAAFWPSLYLNGNLSRDYFDYPGGKPNQDRDWSYGAGLSLQWTVFDGFQTTSAKRIAVAQAQAAHAQLEQAELAASADLWARYQLYQTALKKLTFSAAFLKSSSAAYDLAIDSYKAGLKSVLDVLNAESQVAQARSQSVSARQDAFTALANLAYAAGLLEKGGAAQSLGLPSTPTQKDSQP